MIEVEFAVAHGDHKPDSRAKLPVNEAAHLLRTGRARQQMQSQQMGTLAQGMGMVGEAAKAAKDAGLSHENMDEDTVSQMAKAINPEQLKQIMGANNA